MKRYLPVVIIVLVLVGAVAVSFIFFRSRQSKKPGPFEETSPTPANTSSAGKSPQSTPSPAPSFEKPTNLPVGVSVTVEEFGDYQCPPCGRLYPELKSIEADYGKHVNFVFRNLPLPQIHKNAMLAAQAAESARLQERFEQMHDRLYERQVEWNEEANPRPIFMRYAGELGLNTERFDHDMDGTAVSQRLADDKKRADSLGVVGTPTVFIEGREMKPEMTSGEGIRKGMDLLLARKAAGQ